MLQTADCILLKLCSNCCLTAGLICGIICPLTGLQRLTIVGPVPYKDSYSCSISYNLPLYKYSCSCSISYNLPLKHTCAREARQPLLQRLQPCSQLINVWCDRRSPRLVDEEGSRPSVPCPAPAKKIPPIHVQRNLQYVAFG